jgi:hypothetical protein
VREDAGQRIAIFGPFPVQSRFGNEEMKQRVVGCRDRTPQACLPRPFALTISQMQGLLQQIVGKSHASSPGFLLQSSLSKLAPELEIREQSPLLNGLECLHDSISNAIGDL